MIIDTRKKVIAIQIRRMVTLLTFAVLIICVILIGKMPNTFLGFNKYHWSIIITAIYIGSLIFEGMLQLNYIYFNDEKEKIILRYFSLAYFNRMKKAIEFPKEELLAYQVYEYMNGYKKRIILHRIKNKKEAKYPPVSISILSKDEYHRMLESLNSYKKY